MHTLSNSEDPNERLHYAKFHQGLPYLLRQKLLLIFRERNTLLFENYNLSLLKIYIVQWTIKKVIVTNQKEESIYAKRVNSVNGICFSLSYD